MNKIFVHFKKTIGNYILVATCLSMMPMVQAADAIPDICDASAGYTVALFNGVWNMPDDAQASLAQLRLARSPATPKGFYQNKKVRHEVFYNSTGIVAGGTKFQDVAEVLIQSFREVDSTGAFDNRYESIWESISLGSGIDNALSLTATILAAIPLKQPIKQKIDENAAGIAATALAQMLSAPPTDADVLKHRKQLDVLRNAGQMLLLVAHSQGNLFVNQAFNYIRPLIGDEGVKVAHIAPASPITNGPWLLADIDLVINVFLRLKGFVVPATDAVSFSSADRSGHALVTTYFDGNRSKQIRTVVLAMLEKQMAALKPYPLPASLSGLTAEGDACQIAGFIASGTVVDEAGKPIGGAQVYTQGNGLRYITTSKPDGSYSLYLNEDQAKTLPASVLIAAANAPVSFPQVEYRDLVDGRAIKINFVLKTVALNEQLIVIELVPEVHHIGDGSFATTDNFGNPTVNSSFTRGNEGTVFTLPFPVLQSQTRYVDAEMTFQAKGVQCANQISLNGKLLYLTAASDANGSYSPYKVRFAVSAFLNAGFNTFTFASVTNCAGAPAGDYDDLEFANVQISFK